MRIQGWKQRKHQEPSNLKEIVTRAVESRKSVRALRTCIGRYGETAIWRHLDSYLGDTPTREKALAVTTALNWSCKTAGTMVDHPDDLQRRLARIVLAVSSVEESDKALIVKGFGDPSARIRMDAAALAAGDEDRSRLYNHLVRLIREDVNLHVRRAAGRRIAESFTDLHTPDFEGFPPLSRMLALDALDGRSRSDEECAEALLFSEDGEASFRAARQMRRWGTLKRLEELSGPSAERPSEILRKAEELRAADWAPPPLEDAEDSGESGVFEYDLLMEILNAEDFQGILESRSIRAEELKDALERHFPPAQQDALSSRLFEIAAFYGWQDWEQRIRDALTFPEALVRASAASALAVLAREENGEETARELEHLLKDPSMQVVQAAAAALMNLPSGLGIPVLANVLEEGEDAARDAVLYGITLNPPAANSAECIFQSCRDTLSRDVGIRILRKSVSRELLKELLAVPEHRNEDSEEPDEMQSQLKALFTDAGHEAGEQLLRHGPREPDAEKLKRFVSWVQASGWPEYAVSAPLRSKQAGDLIRKLPSEERKMTFEGILQGADSRSRRRILNLMRTR